MRYEFEDAPTITRGEAEVSSLLSRLSPGRISLSRSLSAFLREGELFVRPLGPAALPERAPLFAPRAVFIHLASSSRVCVTLDPKLALLAILRALGAEGEPSAPRPL